MNNLQRLVGELKGSVEGMKIRMEVDGQGWRGRVEGLEKELEILKEEADDEIIAAKHSLRNEMKVKLGDLMAEMEKLRRHERDEVQLFPNKLYTPHAKLLGITCFTSSQITATRSREVDVLFFFYTITRESMGLYLR